MTHFSAKLETRPWTIVFILPDKWGKYQLEPSTLRSLKAVCVYWDIFMQEIIRTPSNRLCTSNYIFIYSAPFLLNTIRKFCWEKSLP
jgi:hypothetical protein